MGEYYPIGGICSLSFDDCKSFRSFYKTCLSTQYNSPNVPLRDDSTKTCRIRKITLHNKFCYHPHLCFVWAIPSQLIFVMAIIAQMPNREIYNLRESSDPHIGWTILVDPWWRFYQIPYLQPLKDEHTWSCPRMDDAFQSSSSFSLCYFS